MTDSYTLYGSHASYYTAKVRSYLRKKAVPFVERLPSDPMFRNKVRPASGSHRIPQLLAPDGQVIQDSVEIVDFLEARYPDLSAFPMSPLQRTFVHLMELMGSEGLVQLAWQHRWMFEENDKFVKMEFGRSFRPQGDDEELRKYGDLIADRMKSYGLPESTLDIRNALDKKYCRLLELFEALFAEHPYLLGGQPSAADYAIMGALHAHLGRDPAGLRVMQNNAPRTFRWVEHMIVPEVQSPEFFFRAIEYLPGDEVPEPSLDVLRFIAKEYGKQFVLGSMAFNQSMTRENAMSGYELSPEQDQPLLSLEKVNYKDVEYQTRASLYAVWLAQRSQKWFQAQTAETQATISELLASEELTNLLHVPVLFDIKRVDNRLVVA